MIFPLSALAAAVVMAGVITSAAEVVPVWSDGPTTADVAKAYPARARAAHVGGRVTLTCEIEHRRPTQCVALGVEPEGYGFDHAAGRLAGLLLTVDGSLNGKEVQVPVTFDPDVLSGATTVTKPVFVQMPAPSDFQATFPQAANGVNQVRVVLGCLVGAGGVPRDCSVEQEEPAGQGYGQGALPVAAKFRVAPWTARGEPTVGARVRLPIRYELTPATPARP